MLIAALGQYFFGITIFIASIFLVLLVLVQRGRGGGLAGALGGPGGQSAFGTKAGDLFTKITVGVAAVWIFLCASAVFALKEKKFDTGINRSKAGAIGNDNGSGSAGTDSSGAETTVPAPELSGMGTSGTTMAEDSDTSGAEVTESGELSLEPPTEGEADATGTTEGSSGDDK